MKQRLSELLEQGHKNYLYYDQIADYLLENGVIVPPCKVGDYIEWDNGIEKTLYEVKGFLCYENRLRYVLDFFEPIVTHKAITRILTKEEVEQKLKGGERG